jgi:hypothetical protein
MSEKTQMQDMTNEELLSAYRQDGSCERELLDRMAAATRTPQPPAEQGDGEWWRSFDAQVWARKFMEVNATHNVAADEAAMLGWFANAIMAGYDYARNDTARTPQPTDAARAEAHAAFGLAMLRYFYEDEFFFETEQSEDICPILAAHGFMEWRAYDPATDGEHSILYAGDEGWFWTATAIAAARKE